MRKNLEYRLYPTRKQAVALDASLNECRWLYNRLLEERKTAYEQRGENLSLYAQHARLAGLKEERPSLNGVHSQVLQNVAVRLDLAFKAFFRRVKAGEKPGYPRFRGKHRYDSLSFPQPPSGCSIDGKHLKISKVGNVKIKLHRTLEGKPKTCTISRSATGKWYATLSCEIDTPEPLPESAEAVGIDIGLGSFAHLSTDERIENPRFFRTEEKELARVQRKLAKEEKGTPERARRRKVVARVHERIGWRRKNFAHQEARRVVNRFGLIAVEDLNVNRMLHNHCLSKSISDAAWSLFFGLLLSKAAEAGRQATKVNPAHTSQNCSRCGHWQKLTLAVRVFKCPCCGFETSRDHNAAINILSLGRQAVGSEP